MFIENLTAKGAKTANKKGVSVLVLTAKHAKAAKSFIACISLFVPFALFAVHRIQRKCSLEFNRERREIREHKREWPQ